MREKEFVIYFNHNGFESKGFVSIIESNDGEITNQVEVDFEEYFIWKAENGWVDLYGNSNEFITAMGEAIEKYLSKP